jgi:hypothetical protein
MFSRVDQAISLDKFFDNHFILVDDSDLSRKEEKLLATLFRSNANTGESK